MKAIKGFAITPPVIGAIRIGKSIVKDGKKLPQKDDAFTITTLVQNKEGWIAHRLHSELLDGVEPAREGGQAKLRAIPVRVMFDDPDLNLRAEYSVFDGKSGRPVCAGDGENARRRTNNGIEGVDCPGPDMCEFGTRNRCKLYARLNVQIDGQGDELGTFVFRTTGFNSVRTLAARMSYLHAITGGALAGIPLSLKLRAKTSSNSYKASVYFVDLQVREGMTMCEAIGEGQARRAQWSALGLSREAFEAAAREGFRRSAFEEDEEDGAEVVSEFYSSSGPVVSHTVDEDGVINDGGAIQQPRTSASGLAALRNEMGEEPMGDAENIEFARVIGAFA